MTLGNAAAAKSSRLRLDWAGLTPALLFGLVRQLAKRRIYRADKG
jgi:hypothetical protein